MKEYLIFHYVLDGQDYVEAYPVTVYWPAERWAKLLGRDVANDEFAFCSASSRNAARRAAYCNWIRADGVGFASLPYRVYAPEHRNVT